MPEQTVHLFGELTAEGVVASVEGDLLVAWEDEEMPLWTPGALGADLRAFWEGDTVAGNDGDAVTNWVDQTVNAYTLTQGTAANKPTVQVAELNGHRTLRFDGSNDYLSIASVLGLGAQPITSFAVWSMQNSATQVLWQSAGALETGVYITSAGTITVHTTGVDLTAAITKGAWRMTCHRHNGGSGNSSVTIDGNARTTGNLGTSAISTTFFVGASSDLNPTYYLNGDLAALVMIAADVAQAQEDQLFGWAAAKYGLQASLPSGHPYAGAAPTVPGGKSGLRYALGTGLRNRTLR